MTVGITELPPEGMQLGGVALAGDAERGTKTTEGLSLLFTSAGITVQGPQPQIERLLVWSGLDSAACNEKVELSDGRSAAVMELTSGGQSIRFLLPTETVSPGQAAYLDQALPAWLARYRVTGTQPTSTASVAGAENGESGAASSATPAAPSPAETAANAGPAEATQEAPPAPRMSPAPAAGAAAAAATVGAGAAAAGAAAGVGTSTSSNGGRQETGVTSAPPPPAQAAAPAPPPPTQTIAPAPPPPPPTPAAAPPPPPPAQAAAPPPPPAQAAPPPPPPPSVEGRPAPPPGVVGAPLPPSGFAPLDTGEPTQTWDVLGDGSPQPTAWDDPPLGTAPPPEKKEKTSFWKLTKRTKRTAEPAAPVGIFAVPAPPSDPPEEPVPLDMTLPPPSSQEEAAPRARGGFRWRPQSRDKSKVAPEPEPVLQPEPQAPAAFTAPEHESVTGIPTAPGDVVVLSAATAKKRKRSGRKEGEPPSERVPSGGRRRQLTVLLVVLLLLVVGGIAYFVAKKNNNTTTTSSPPVTSGVAADAALATSVNLRLADLPSGWGVLPATVPPARPLAAPIQAQRTADTALASCLGVAVQTTSALFGGTTIAGEMSPAESPIFQDVSATGFQMHSTTTVLSSAAQAQSLAAPFASATFVPCYAQHQSAIVAAASPGSVAQLQVVTLQAPPGVKAYGYLTDITTPSGGKEVVGQAFMFGGRVSSLLEPTTEGPPVPSSAFVPAFNAMTARIAGAASR